MTILIINCLYYSTTHAEGLVNPKVRAKKGYDLDTYPRACRFRKRQIENRFPELRLPTFSAIFTLGRGTHQTVLERMQSKNETFLKKIEKFNFCQF
jgi:hypothetical protein